MFIYDTHTHTSYSMDANVPPRDMAEAALWKGLGYIAFTDHYNADYFNIKEMYRENSSELKYPFDVNGQLGNVREVSDEYAGRIYVAAGVERGYSKDSEDIYLDTLDARAYDVIINSVHTVFGEDIYDMRFFDKKTRERVLKDYLYLVRESIETKWSYDIIGHIGYISRRMPYEKKLITLDEFHSEIDDILNAIIKRDKCLELNTQTKNTPYVFLPSEEILRRYYELGGRKISFGSDTHVVGRIADKYDITAKIAKEIGFEGFTYYVNREPMTAKFDD